MYKQFKAVNERDKRLYMAGLSLSQLIGFKSARDFCMNTVLAVGDIDTDEMLFFSNSIDRDVRNVEEYGVDCYSKYFKEAVDAYIHPDHLEKAQKFFAPAHLHECFERGMMSDSLEYPCLVGDDVVWIRACWELEQDDETGHVIATVALIDITRLRANEQVSRDF